MMGKLNLVYSIKEIAWITGMKVNDVAEGLLASGVVLIYKGKPVDLSTWERWRRNTSMIDGEHVTFITEGTTEYPEPENVIVSTEAMPQSWKDLIMSAYESDEGDKPKTQDINPKSKTVALKIIGGLLMEGYRMDIHAERLVNLQEVMKDLEKVGAGVAENTLRTWIKEAAEVIEPRKT
jgi:hypothetical protein